MFKGNYITANARTAKKNLKVPFNIPPSKLFHLLTWLTFLALKAELKRKRQFLKTFAHLGSTAQLGTRGQDEVNGDTLQ